LLPEKSKISEVLETEIA